MNVHRSLWLALPLAFLLPLGCNNAVETGQASDPAAASPAAAAPAPEAQAQTNRHGRHHARSAAHMLLRAAKTLDLDDAQKATIENLAVQLRGDRTAERTSHQAMRTALAASVRAGSVDPSALPVASTTTREARAQREATALNGLWAVLEPAQRQALVTSVKERQAARAARWANHEKTAQAGGWATKRLAHLTTELSLDADQQVAVGNIMAANRPSPATVQAFHTQMQSRNAALYTAFQGDAFDASKLPAVTPPAGATMGRGQHAQFLAQLVPILRADQRETLATSIETRQN